MGSYKLLFILVLFTVFSIVSSKSKFENEAFEFEKEVFEMEKEGFKMEYSDQELDDMSQYVPSLDLRSKYCKYCKHCKKW